MELSATPLAGVMVITPARHGDARGFFSESWSAARMARAGLDLNFVQDNHSLSHQAGTVRGLHFQRPPAAQAKLVRCGRGALFDVAVDIRKGSPTYGRWTGTELSFDNGRQMLIPEGFLHGFMTLRPNTEIIYKCTEHYAPEHEGAVRFDDPDIGIDWPQAAAGPVLSDKDLSATAFAALDSPFSIGGAQ